MNPIRISIIILLCFAMLSGVFLLYISLVTQSSQTTGPSWEKALSKVVEDPVDVARDEESRQEREERENELAHRDPFLHIEHRAKRPCVYQEGRLNHGEDVVAYEKRRVAFDQECVSETRVCNDGVLSGSFNNTECIVGKDNSCYVSGLRMDNGYSKMFYSQKTAPYPESCLQYGILRTCDYGELNGDSLYTYSNCDALPAKDCAFNGDIIKHGDFTRLYRRATVPFGNVCLSEARICQGGILSGSYTYESCSVEENN